MGVRLITEKSDMPHLVGLQATMLVISKWKVVVQRERHQLNMKPARPWNGLPVISSWFPGASPMNNMNGPDSTCINPSSLSVLALRW